MFSTARYKVVGATIKFCLSSELFASLDNFVVSHSASVEASSNASADYTLEATKLHAEYVNKFETQLKQFLEAKKSSVPEFYEAIQQLNDLPDSNAAVQTFVDVLTQVTDFQTFIDLARDRSKRDYLKSLMNHYARMAETM